MSRPKAVGTRAETAIVTYLTGRGVPARREVLHGSADQGDVWAHGGRIVVEVKSRGTRPSDESITAMWGEAQAEAARVPQCDAAVLVVKRPGRSAQRCGDWWAWTSVGDLLWLLGGEVTDDPDIDRGLVSMTVEALATIVARSPQFGVTS